MKDLPFVFFFTNPGSYSLGECPEPTDISLTGKTSTTASFDWPDAGSESDYNVYYTCGEYTSSTFKTSSSNYTFTALIAGTYDFYFQTDCGSEVSEWIIVEDQIIQ